MLDTSSPHEVENQPTIDILYYIRLLLANAWKIILATVIGTAIAVYYATTIPAKYSATARIILETNQGNVAPVRDVFDVGTQRREFLMTQAQILQSRAIVEKVVDKLDLVNNDAMRPPKSEPMFPWLSGLFESEASEEDQPSPEEVRERLIDAIRSGINVRPIRNTQLVDISFESLSPRLAAAVPNAVADAYVEIQMDARLAATQRATSWLNERLQGLRSELEQSERALQTFQKSEGLVDIQGVRGLAEQQLNDSMMQLLEARRKVKELSGIYRQISLFGENVDAVANLPEILNHPLIQSVKGLEVTAAQRVSELSQRYGPKHPRMIAAREEQQNTHIQLRNEVLNLISSIKANYEFAQSQVRTLEKDLADNKGDVQQVAFKEIRYDELKREVEVNTQLYNSFLTRFKEASEATGFQYPAARLIEPATAPKYPLSSKKRLIVLIAMMFSGGLVAGIVLLIDLLKANVRSSDDVERKLHQRILGLLPSVADTDTGKDSTRLFYNKQTPEFAEAVRTLRTGLLLMGDGTPSKLISITSSVPSEGKTTVAENLSFALNQVGKVVLVDSDLRRASVSKRFGLSPSRPGLADLLMGNFALEECTYTDPDTGLDVIPVGKVPVDPLRLLAVSEFRRVLEELSERYDVVILDTPPVQAVSDGMVVSKLCDSVLYVVKAEGTSARVIRKGIKRLREVGVRIEGVVLNQVDTGRLSSDSYEYYNNYYGPDPEAST